MRRKILIVALCLCVVSTILVCLGRWQVEKDNRWVEMGCDYNQVSQLSLQWGYELDNFLLRLKEAGIGSVAIQEETLETLSSEGKLTLITGKELKKSQYLAPVQSNFLQIMVKNGIEKHSIILTSNLSLAEKMERILVGKLGGKRVSKIEKILQDRNLIGLSICGVEEKEIPQLEVGFSTEKIVTIANSGLRAILVFTNSPYVSGASIEALFGSVTNWEKTSAIIFSGDSVLGYPHFFDAVDRELEKREVKIGIVEFLNQEGSGELAKRLYRKVVRVHAIPPEDINGAKVSHGVDLSSLIARFQRAVRERNIRLLYVHLPFISGSNENLQIQSNLDYVRGIKTALIEEGFKIGYSQPLKPFPAWLNFFRLPLFLLGLLLPLWLISFYKSFSPIFYPFYLFASLVATLFFWQNTLFIQIVAGTAALFFPLWALVSGLFLPGQSLLVARRSGNVSRAIWLFLRVTIFTLFGGLVIASLLSRVDFMLNIHQFRGVKLSLILPLIIGPFLVWGWSQHHIKEKGSIRFHLLKLSEFLSRKVEFRHLLVFSILALGAIVLLLRSGNYPGRFLWEIENEVREILEKLFIVRPRIKEFFIGHPLMVLGITLYLAERSGREKEFRIRDESWPWFIVLGLVGQISIVNSFCHAHTPLAVSLVRTINGIWLGIIIGILLSTIFIRKKADA